MTNSHFMLLKPTGPTTQYNSPILTSNILLTSNLLVTSPVLSAALCPS